MTVNLEIGLVTPPVGLNLYVVKNIAPDVPMSQGAAGGGPICDHRPAGDRFVVHLAGTGNVAAEQNDRLTRIWLEPCRVAPIAMEHTMNAETIKSLA